MARPLRHDPVNGWHHVMNRGANRQRIFFADSDRIDFGERLAEINQRFDVRVHAYCLMDNHFHLLVHCPNGGLSAAMQHLASMFTRHVNDRTDRDGALFRGRFHSRLVADERYLLAACRYIHRNPLDLGDDVDLGEYRWSSHRTYLGHRRRPSWLTTSTILRMFGEDRDAFDRFVVGTPAGSRVEEITELVDIARLHDAVRLVISEVLVHEREAPRSLAKTAVLGVVTGSGAAPCAEFYGITSSGALRSAQSRARRRLASDPQLRLALERALQIVAPAKPRVTAGLTPDDTRVSLRV